MEAVERHEGSEPRDGAFILLLDGSEGAVGGDLHLGEPAQILAVHQLRRAEGQEGEVNMGGFG